MRTSRNIAVAIAIAIVVAVALVVSPAGAKGPQHATIDGPGLEEPIDQRDAGMSKLPSLTGLFGPLWDDPSVPLVDEAPTTDLGPAYVVTWDLGPYGTEPTTVRQTVYPYAAGDHPLVHTEAGQRFYGEETGGGWYVAPQALRDMLIASGLPTSSEARDELGAPADRGQAAASTPDPADRGWLVPAGVAAAALAVGAAASVGLVRRRGAMAATNAV